MTVPSATDGTASRLDLRRAMPLVLLLAAIVWSYWPTLRELAAFWNRNPDYSVGALVPLIAVWLVWSDRKALGVLPIRVSPAGLGVLLTAQVARFLGVYGMYGSLERYSLWLSAVGVVWGVFGAAIVRRLTWVLAFLLLLVPLPNRVHDAVSIPLQEFATASAVFGLEALGFLVAREGNVIHLSRDTTLNIAEACSGLRMLTAFVVVASVLAFLVRRPPWQKTLLVASSILVAILANSARVVTTGVLYEVAGGKVAERFFHDFAGVTMMPLAVLVLLGELHLLRWISGPDAPPGTTGAVSPSHRPG